MIREEEYLGDGLYASFDGYSITLRAPRGPDGDHWVGLERPVYEALKRFAEKVGLDEKAERRDAS